VIILRHVFFCFIQSHKHDKVPENQQKWFGLSRQAYFKNSSESRLGFIIRNGSNEWSLSDYKRRVSSTATVQASYETRSSKSVLPVSGGAPPRSPGSQVSANDEYGSDILGLAAGGQMYGARNLRLLIFSLIS
jgi:hypothetical protein